MTEMKILYSLDGKSKREIQDTTIYARDTETENSISDLIDLMEWLRQDGLYAQSDRLRTIIGRLARTMPQGGLAYKPMYRMTDEGAIEGSTVMPLTAAARKFK